MAPKVVCVYLVLCIGVTLWDISQAKPLEYDNPKSGKAPSDKLLQILAKQHSNSQPPEKVPMLRDFLYPSRAYPPDENGEVRQMPMSDNANIPYSPLELLQALAEYEANDDYYQDQANTDGLYYTEGQDGWFDGPILPKVNTDRDEVPMMESRPPENSQEGPNEEQLNKLLINYLYDHYNKGDIPEEEDDSIVEKRRQKIVIKDDVEVTTPVIPSSTTSSTRKAKFQVHKPIKTNRHGQKEVALLRPANASESKEKDWPQELEDNNLDEEESLREMGSQSRQVRDVLTSQLDGLKEEHKSGAASDASSSSKN